MGVLRDEMGEVRLIVVRSQHVEWGGILRSHAKSFCAMFHPDNVSGPSRIAASVHSLAM